MRAQDTLSVMTYNVLNFAGPTGAGRASSFRTILDQYRPDILVVSEMLFVADMNLFLEDILNHTTDEYSAGPFVNGNDTDNAVFYKHDKVKFIDNLSITTSLRLINGYRFTIKSHADTTFQFQVFSAHLKASRNDPNPAKRLAEVEVFNDRIKTGVVDSTYIFAGDFNFYTATEPGYQFLMNSMAIDLEDPINAPGNWHVNPSFASIHTQSTRTATNDDGGSTGGLDDRFDFILLSDKFFSGPLLKYVDGSYITPGNDGNSFNTFVSDIAFRTASDHLPVMLKIEYPTDALTPLEFSSLIVDNGLLLTWNPNVGGDLDFFALYRSTQVDFDPDTMPSFTFATTDSFFLDTTITGQEIHFYRISSFDESGNESPFSNVVSNMVVGIADEGTIPVSYTLYQNYPNPFNPVTSINYILPKESNTTLTIYNLLGREVAKLVNRVQPAGVYSVKWNASNVSTGVYFYKLQSGDFLQTRKMLLLK